MLSKNLTGTEEHLYLFFYQIKAVGFIASPYAENAIMYQRQFRWAILDEKKDLAERSSVILFFLPFSKI